LIAEKKYALRKKPQSDELETEEEFAERYERSVISRMERGGIYRLGARLLRLAAAINYSRGARAWQKKNFDQAAHYFDMAIQVEPTHREANYWFWKAREKVKGAVEQGK
jgi:hypothetical protein